MVIILYFNYKKLYKDSYKERQKKKNKINLNMNLIPKTGKLEIPP
jgi:hypothetical protein